MNVSVRTLQEHRFCHLLLIFSLAFLCPLAAGAGEVQTLPPSPVFTPGLTAPDVHAMEQTGSVYSFTNPYIPPVSNSQDHRIGLMRKRTASGDARFVLLAPERLNSHVLDTDGAEILSPVIDTVAVSTLHNAVATTTHTPFVDHLTLCDPQNANPSLPGDVNPNPVACNGEDCYNNMKVITGVIYKPINPATHAPYLELWSVPASAVVTNPKEAGATLSVSVTPNAHTSVQITGYGLGGIQNFHTPMIVGDNRLLVVRFGHLTEIEWQDDTPVTHNGRYDAVYAWYADDKDPSTIDECDITQWDNFKPLANAPHDANVNGRYGFAKQEFFTPSGASVPHTDDIPARYLWVDQGANNVFFATLSRLLHDDYQGNGSCGSAGDCLYDIACVNGVSCDLYNSDPLDPSETTPPHQGWMMVGLWTHGKMVLLDSAINHSDFGLEGEEEHHRMVTLYSNGPAIRVGTGRDADPITGTAFGWIDTTVQFGSTEHFFNMVPNMRPRSPFDVVWQVTAGAQSDELAFDEYISHRTLIFSPMNALKEMVGNPQIYYDGNDPNSTEMRLQNAATSPGFDLPSYGTVVVPTGTNTHGRIENVALGGIKGRGFYLDPKSRIEYVIPSQTGLEDEEWVISLFYDLKVVEGSVRRLFTFPGGDFIDLHGLTSSRVCGGGGFGCITVPLAKPQSTSTWTHLAYHLVDDKIRIYQDGFLFTEINRPSTLKIEPGTLEVGAPSSGAYDGVGGWIDELRVVAGPEGTETFNLEQLCNHARGTLVAVPYTYKNLTGNTLAALLDPFENATQGRDEIHKALNGPAAVIRTLASDYYICNIDYTQAKGISVHDPGDPLARSIRRRMLFPEGPLVWNQPRPESGANAFCLSCHQSTGQGGLDLNALTLNTLAEAQNDLRRQPSQPPSQIFGMMPAHYFGDAPAVAETDAKIDQWIDDGPMFQWPFDETAGGKFLNWRIGDVNQSSNDGSRNTSIYKPGAGRAHALEFDGVGDSARIDHNLNIAGEELTLAAWFIPYIYGGSSAPEDECRIDVGVDSPCTLIAKSLGDIYWSLQVFYLANDPSPRWRARFEVRGSSGTVQSHEVDLDDPNTATPNDFVGTWWHHLAGTYGDGELEIYLDGNSMGSLPVTAYPLATSSTYPVTLGSELDSSDNPVAVHYGRVDDVRIYNRRLTPGDVAELVLNSP